MAYAASRTFSVPDNATLELIRQRLAVGAEIHRAPKIRVTRYVLDTFDRRIEARGDLLLAEKKAGGVHLSYAFADGRTLNQRIDELPKFASELPNNLFRSELEKVIEVRALLPLARNDLIATPWQLLNGEGKTVLRMQAERPAAKRGQQGLVLRMVPLRGYAKARDEAISLLEQASSNGLRVTPLVDDPLVAEIPPPPPQPEPPQFSGATRSDLAIKSILEHQRATIELNLEGTRENIDSEFLHDLRVAVRRTRSLIGQAKDALPAKRLAHFKKEFAWLGKVTSGARDMDVFLLDYSTLCAPLPEDIRGDMELFRQHLLRRSERERAALNSALDNTRFSRLMASWGRFLAIPVPARPSARRARFPIARYSAEQILAVYERAIKQGKRIALDSPDTALHELRKTCKKLRYLFEFFRPLHPPKETERAIKTLKGLQDVLGRFQDCCVQMQMLTEFEHDLRLDSKAAADTEATLRASGQLIECLSLEANQVRKSCLKRFQKFASPALHKRYRNLLGKPID